MVGPAGVHVHSARMNSKLVVVLLPGLDGTGLQFRRLVECAPERFEPEVVSYPGDEVLDYAQLESRVRAKLPDRPYLLVGESFSGPIAVSIASRPSPNLRGLVLAASFVTPPALPIWRFLPWRLAFGFPAPALLLRRCLAPRDGDLVRGMRTAIQAVAPEVLAARVRATLEVDKRRELAAVECPLLYLQAQQDIVVARRCLRQVLEVKPEATVENLPTAHPVLQIDPEGAWRAIERFAP